MRLAALLLCLAAATHYGYAPLASLFPDPDRAARALFYVLRGLEGVGLFAVVGLLARRPVVWAVCLWGAFEEGETAVCRLARGLDAQPGHELFQGLCGAPWYAIGVLIATALALYLHNKQEKGSDDEPQ